LFTELIELMISEKGEMLVAEQLQNAVVCSVVKIKEF
jgi:hypothetical protein